MASSGEERTALMTRGGRCKDAYQAFGACLVVCGERSERCREAALKLNKCMDEHAGRNYAPRLVSLPAGAGGEGKKKDGEEEADFLSFLDGY